MEQVFLPLLAGYALRTIWALVSIMTQDVPKGWLYGITERRLRLIREIKNGIWIIAATILYHFIVPSIAEDTNYNMYVNDSTYRSY